MTDLEHVETVDVSLRRLNLVVDAARKQGLIIYLSEHPVGGPLLIQMSRPYPIKEGNNND